MDWGICLEDLKAKETRDLTRLAHWSVVKLWDKKVVGASKSLLLKITPMLSIHSSLSSSNSTCSHFTSSRHRQRVLYRTSGWKSWKNTQYRILNCEKASWFYCWWLNLILEGFDLQNNPLVWRAHPLKVLYNYFVHYDSSFSNPKAGNEPVKQRRQELSSYIYYSVGWMNLSIWSI